jgi:aspartokinase-like uncharacterized kinase
LFEYGLLLNDSLALKFAVLTNAGTMTADARGKLLADIQGIITPDFKDPQESIDEKLPALMKELENTIITFDRDSMRRIRREIKDEKMQV